MAHSDKNIVITPSIGSTTTDPRIVFSGADATLGPQNITLRAYPTNSGTLSFEGSAGQLFSITNSLTGTIFSVNDISGIPSIEVLDTGLVKLAQYSGNVLLGTATDNGTNKLQVTGSILATSFSGAGTGLTGTAASLSIGGNAANVTGTVAVANGGTGSTTAGGALTNLGAYAASNPSGYTSNAGTVTSVAALTLGTTGTDVSSTVATGTTTAVITLNIPTASATNRGALSAADWTTFNGKQAALGFTPYNATNPSGYTSNTGTVTSVGGTGTVSGLTLTGTVTTTGNLTLGGTLAVTASNFASQTANTVLAAPNGAAGVPTFRALVAADIPTLNQNTTGSSGSCTGNAATATSADQIDGINFRNTGSNAGINADSLNSNGITYYTAGVTNFSGNATDGALYSQIWDSTYQHQIAGDYRSGQIALRGKNAGTWQAWRTVLDSTNYTTYSPTLTGTGASGSWGISVTGSSASCTGNAATATTAASCTGNAATATTATNAYYHLSQDRNRATMPTPISRAQQVQFDFANGAVVGGTVGNYAGIMTWAPYDGTSASTGDATYQIGVCGTAANAGGYARMVLRKGIDSTWNSWQELLTSSNISSYAATLSAGGVVLENSRTISANYTMTSGKSGSCTGPITVNSGITVTIPSGSRWVVL